jgi:hypothetical protein
MQKRRKKVHVRREKKSKTIFYSDCNKSGSEASLSDEVALKYLKNSSSWYWSTSKNESYWWWECQCVGSRRGEFRILPTFVAQWRETRGFNTQERDGEIRLCGNTMCIQCRHSNHGPGAQKLVVWLELDIWERGNREINHYLVFILLYLGDIIHTLSVLISFTHMIDTVGHRSIRVVRSLWSIALVFDEYTLSLSLSRRARPHQRTRQATEKATNIYIYILLYPVQFGKTFPSCFPKSRW